MLLVLRTSLKKKLPHRLTLCSTLWQPLRQRQTTVLRFAIGTVILQAPSQENTLLIQFSLQQFGYLFHFDESVFLENKEKKPNGVDLGVFPSQALRDGVQGKETL